jgi:hypothetical protein
VKSAWWTAPCIALPALLAAPAFGGRVLLFRDILHFILPQQAFAAAARAGGHLPLWDPGRYGGAPFFAEPGTGVLYPPNFLFHFLSPAHAATWFVLLHLPVAGAGAYLMARRLSLSAPAAALAGCGFASSGYLLSMHGGHYYLASAALLPGVCAALLCAADRRTPRTAGAAAAMVALAILNGEMQALFFAAIFAAVLALCGTAQRVRSAVWVGASLLLGAALGAVQLVPTALFARATVRASGFSLPEAGTWALHPVRWIELLAADPFGVPWPDNGYWGSAFVSAAGRHLPWAISVYLGPALLIPALLTGWPREGRRRALLAMAAVALILAAGSFLPIFQLWLRIVPLADRFRYAEKYALPATLALALLGAWKAEELTRVPRAALLGFAAAAAVLLAAAAVAWAGPSWLDETIARGLREAEANLSEKAAHAQLIGSLLQGALLCAALAIAALAARRNPAVLPPVLLGAALVAQGAHGLRILSWGEGSFLGREPAFLAPWRAALGPDSTGRVLNDGSCRYQGGGSGSLLERVRAFEWDTGKQNFPLLFGLREALGYGAAENARQLALVRNLHAAGLEATARTIGAAAIISCRAGHVQVEKVAMAIPRVRVVPAGHEVDGVHNPAGDANNVHFGAAVLEERPERVRIAATGPGLLVLADTAAPGWTARVDGVLAPVRTVEAEFRAVDLREGDHEVLFEYSAPGLRAGALVSALALLVCLIGLAAEHLNTRA